MTASHPANKGFGRQHHSQRLGQHLRSPTAVVNHRASEKCLLEDNQVKRIDIDLAPSASHRTQQAHSASKSFQASSSGHMSFALRQLIVARSTFSASSSSSRHFSDYLVSRPLRLQHRSIGRLSCTIRPRPSPSPASLTIDNKRHRSIYSSQGSYRTSSTTTRTTTRMSKQEQIDGVKSTDVDYKREWGCGWFAPSWWLSMISRFHELS